MSDAVGTPYTNGHIGSGRMRLHVSIAHITATLARQERRGFSIGLVTFTSRAAKIRVISRWCGIHDDAGDAVVGVYRWKNVSLHSSPRPQAPKSFVEPERCAQHAAQ